ncbi:AraC family transcriptional regulator [Cohnella lubricantis]|uniref:Helix-turn-helix domain-containing protein n=1 Tax=Cohnella lubricantis TaxID=2163172 RepID=A0A841TA25_9BACL|nr:AraC family transcriptional regulator [Cohnella lubricantis]MBB6676906.1 helix-turn-helix domain-containing protein [Cohnella lubricantis]MBP2118307.1 AraC-like DNA-binding protein [Cohnella lubricantis]
MTRIPMMLQLALILFLVMAIPTGILSWYSGSQMLRNSEEAIAESSLAGLNANRELNENALNNLAQDTVRLAVTNIFDRIRSFETFEELNANYSNVSRALSIMQELLNLNHRVDGVYSTFFYLDHSDYVISTDRGITALERYEPIDWMEEALADRQGISGVWYPRRMASGVNVVSYVLPLSRLSTTTRGTIVVNMRESQIGEYLRSSEPGEHGYSLLDSDGTIISHNDKSLLLASVEEQPFMQDILADGTAEGYAFRELEGEHLLYTWSRSELFGWWNVNVYSMDELMTKTYRVQRSNILTTAVILLAGTILTVFLATWLSKPVRELVRTVRAHGHQGASNKKNELAFLNAAFRRMQEEEEGLYKLLREREQDTRSLALHHLLRGEVTSQIAEMFPERYYLVAIVSIDRYRRYVNKTNPETRSYHRYLLISQCERLFPVGVNARSIYQGDGCFAIVVNYGQEESDRGLEGIKEALDLIRDQAAGLLGHSVTIGVSREAEASSMVSERAVEAMEVIKHRMIEGSGGITFWRQEADRSKKYIYPANSERRMLNFLDAGDLGSIVKELAMIRQEIQSVEYISYDNIMFIYNQLVGVTIKHLRESNISTAHIFAGRGNIYSTIAAIDTLDELEEYLREFFGEIIQYLARNPSELNYGERIIRYLEEHYCEDIVFEHMAKEIGISYSYMRKIVYELTGKSLIDYTNSLRIEKAKQLLLESSLNMTQIASEVGYYNVQSFNRFFRKYEGMPPSSYKASKSRTS